eukprot:3567327-Rhodomonas_salina.1
MSGTFRCDGLCNVRYWHRLSCYQCLVLTWAVLLPKANGLRVPHPACYRHPPASAGTLGLRVHDSRLRFQGSGLRISGSRFRVQGSGFRVQGSGFR